MTRPFKAPLYPVVPAFALPMACVSMTAMIDHDLELLSLFAATMIVAVTASRQAWAPPKPRP